MQRTLQEHVAQLGEKIVILKRKLRNPDLSAYQKADRQLDLLNAEEALMLFRKAYELEQRVSSDQLPRRAEKEGASTRPD